MPFDPAALRQAAEAAPGWDEPPPSDVYQVELHKAETFTSKADRDTLRLTWKVLTGRLRDHDWSQIQTLEPLKVDGSSNEDALRFTGEVLKALGIDIAAIQSPMDLRPQLDRVTGGAYEVEVKRNGQYTNTYVKRKLDQVQAEMPVSGYGQPPAGAGNAIYQGDNPMPTSPPQGFAVRENEGNTEPGPPPPPRSDVPEPGVGEFRHPPQKGDIDPATGEPFPF